MRISIRFLIFVVACSWTTFGLFGQSAEYETILLPVATKPLSGALGSLWKTEFVIVNNGAVDLDPNLPARDVYPLDSECGVQPPCPPIPTIQAYTAQFPFLFLRDGGPPGVLLHVRRSFLDDLAFNLRTQDLSRQSLTWGTEIPVVRESDLSITNIVLANIPLDERFRQALRVYDIDSKSSSSVRVRVYPIEASIPLVDTTLTLTRPSPSPCVGTQEDCYPSYAEIQNFRASFPSLAGHESVRVQIDSLSAGLRFWAFVSVTNNETQHVTTITPQ
jgi:hypothetical protein